MLLYCAVYFITIVLNNDENKLSVSELEKKGKLMWCKNFVCVNIFLHLKCSSKQIEKALEVKIRTA